MRLLSIFAFFLFAATTLAQPAAFNASFESLRAGADLQALFPMDISYACKNAVLSLPGGDVEFKAANYLAPVANDYAVRYFPGLKSFYTTMVANRQPVEAVSPIFDLEPADSWTLTGWIGESAENANFSVILLSFNSATANSGLTLERISNVSHSYFLISGFDDGTNNAARTEAIPNNDANLDFCITLMWDGPNRRLKFLHNEAVMLDQTLNANDALNTSPLTKIPHLNGKLRLNQRMTSSSGGFWMNWACIGFYKTVLTDAQRVQHNSICNSLISDVNVRLPIITQILLSKQLLAFYPLSRSFGLSNAMPQSTAVGVNSGIISGVSNEINFVNGPFYTSSWPAGDFHSAVQLDQHYLEFQSPHFNFTNSSFSVLFSYDLKNTGGFGGGALLAMDSHQSSSGYAIRKHSLNDNSFEFKTNEQIANHSIAFSKWEWISASWNKESLSHNYHHGHSHYQINASVSQYPESNGRIYLGVRTPPTDLLNDGARFACLAIFKTATNYYDRFLVQHICNYMENTVCPSSCVNCIFETSSPFFSCPACKTGYAGSTCGTKIFSCSSYCAEGSTCVRDLPTSSTGSCNQCQNGFTGPKCQPPSDPVQFLERFRISTKMVAYFPLNAFHSLNDIISGTLAPNTQPVLHSSNVLTTVPGPFGNNGATIATSGYVSDYASAIDINPMMTSFTVSFWYQFIGSAVVSAGTSRVIISFQSLSRNPGLTILRHFNQHSKYPYIEIKGKGPNSLWMDCPLASNNWMKIALVWNSLNRAYTIYCNDDVLQSEPYHDYQNEWSFQSPHIQGKMAVRMMVHDNSSFENSKLACLGIYQSALSKEQIDHSNGFLCEKANGFNCAYCAPNACIYDRNSPTGYRCTACISGYFEGPLCTPFCGEHCMPGRCSLVPGDPPRALCGKCQIGYIGDQCQEGGCDCGGLGECVSPGWCRCTDGSLAMKCHPIKNDAMRKAERPRNSKMICTSSGLNSQTCRHIYPGEKDYQNAE